MELSKVQVKAFADRAREELTDDVLAAAYLGATIGGGSARTVDIPPGGGRVKAQTPKRAPRAATPEKAAAKRTRTTRGDSAEIDSRVLQALKAAGGPSAIGAVIKATSLQRPKVQLALKHLESGGFIKKNANGKRDTTYEAV